ncbi:hypothetical protein ONS96_009004 [Cadophora gregata f. sp. sojae]|nr:hypothetical protein ONS96_009004 [Cadophora gregata f. sp. sojae]
MLLVALGKLEFERDLVDNRLENDLGVIVDLEELDTGLGDDKLFKYLYERLDFAEALVRGFVEDDDVCKELAVESFDGEGEGLAELELEGHCDDSELIISEDLSFDDLNDEDFTGLDVGVILEVVSIVATDRDIDTDLDVEGFTVDKIFDKEDVYCKEEDVIELGNLLLCLQAPVTLGTALTPEPIGMIYQLLAKNDLRR